VSFQVILLAGGMGTRIKSVAGNLPKALIPVAGRPFIRHQLELLRRNDLVNVLLLVGYRGDLIERELGDGSSIGFNITYVHEQPDRLLGTGGAILNALDHLADEFMIMYGDSYLPVDYQAMIQWYKSQKRPAVMSVFKNHGQWDSSNVRIGNDRVIYYDKKAKPGDADYIDYGLSILTKNIMRRYLQHPVPLDLAVILSDLVASDQLAAYEVTQRFYEIGKPEGLAELDALLRKSE